MPEASEASFQGRMRCLEYGDMGTVWASAYLTPSGVLSLHVNSLDRSLLFPTFSLCLCMNFWSKGVFWDLVNFLANVRDKSIKAEFSSESESFVDTLRSHQDVQISSKADLRYS